MHPEAVPMSIEQFKQQAVSSMANGGIMRLGYANGQLVQPGPGRPGYGGPHETYDTGKSYEEARERGERDAWQEDALQQHRIQQEARGEGEKQRKYEAEAKAYQEAEEIRKTIDYRNDLKKKMQNYMYFNNPKNPWEETGTEGKRSNNYYAGLGHYSTGEQMHLPGAGLDPFGNYGTEGMYFDNPTYMQTAEVTRPQYNTLKSLGQVGNVEGSAAEIKEMVPAGTFDSIRDSEWEQIFKGDKFKDIRQVSAEGGIARLGYANGQLVQPGPGRPGYGGPHETYDTGKSYEEARERGERDAWQEDALQEHRTQQQTRGEGEKQQKYEAEAKAYQEAKEKKEKKEQKKAEKTAKLLMGHKIYALKKKGVIPSGGIMDFSMWKSLLNPDDEWPEWAKGWNMSDEDTLKELNKIAISGPYLSQQKTGWDTMKFKSGNELLDKIKSVESGEKKYHEVFGPTQGGPGEEGGPLATAPGFSPGIPPDETPPDDSWDVARSDLPYDRSTPTHDFSGKGFYGADGGRAGYANGGGIRQRYLFGGLGRLFKKITKPFKKITKSKAGKLAIMAALGYFGGGGGIGSFKGWGGAGFGGSPLAKMITGSGSSLKNLFTRQEPTASWLSKNAKIWGKGGEEGLAAWKKAVPWYERLNPWTTIGIPSLVGGAWTAMNPEKDEDEMYNRQLAKKKYWLDRFGPDWDVTPDDPLYPRGLMPAADGGRIGYAGGKTARMIALNRLAGIDEDEDKVQYAQEGGLMNLGGMEKDYRQEGGFVPIGGQERADDVPARLSKNEFVFTADAVRAAGGGDIDAGAEVMENVMENLEQGGEISQRSQGLEGARDMFATAKRLEGVL